MANPDFSDITTCTLNGTGLFDNLMVSVKEHLSEEYSSQRLRGSDYSKVYLGSMEACLRDTIQYLLGIALVDAQKRKLDLEAQALSLQISLFPLEKQKLEAEVAYLEAQITSLERKTNAEVAKLEADTALTETQEDLLAYQLANEKPLEVEKLEAEVDLIEAKTASEKLQPDLVAANIELIKTQTEGFGRDAEQKSAKIYADNYAVQKSVVEELAPPAGLTAAETTRVMNKLLEGINA